MSLPQMNQWHQGNIIKLKELGLNDCDGLNLALVISHDCDIVHDNETEPFIEFVCGKIIDSVNGNYENGKNPRILHLPLKHNGNRSYIELRAYSKKIIRKDALTSYNPDIEFDIDNKSNILQSWLSARYNRQALPDCLVDRLRPVAKLIEKEGKRHSSIITGYWFSYDPKSEITNDEPYEINFYVIYSTDKVEYADIANEIAEKIKEKINAIGELFLKECKAFSDREFTVRDITENIQFRFDHLSNRTDPPGNIVL